MRPALLASSLLATATLTLPATAAEPRVHDALHLRAAFGLGYAGDHFASDEVNGLMAEDPAGEAIEGNLGGVAVAGEISAGYGVVEGGFLGAGFYFNHVPSPHAGEIDWITDIDEVDFESGGFWMLGPMFDYYPDPAAGLHLTLAVGFARFGLGDGDAELELPIEVPVADQQGAGVSGMLGVGYDFWIADVASLGVLGRFMIARTGAEDDNDVDWHHTVYSPALLLSASFD